MAKLKYSGSDSEVSEQKLWENECANASFHKIEEKKKKRIGKRVKRKVNNLCDFRV